MNKTVANRPTLEKRLAALESEFDVLRDKLLGLAPIKKDWRSTVGSLPDDAMTRRAFRAGAQWRKGRKAS